MLTISVIYITQYLFSLRILHHCNTLHANNVNACIDALDGNLVKHSTYTVPG